VDLSAQGRIDAWRSGMRMIQARPFGGVGIGAFVVGYDAYAPGDAGPARTGHNSFMMIAAELGVPALALFILALVASFFALGRIAAQAGRGDPDGSAGGGAKRSVALSTGLARALQTALFGFVVSSLTGGYAFTWPIYIVFAMAAAVQMEEAP
jgi:O-antigen ligase